MALLEGVSFPATELVQSFCHLSSALPDLTIAFFELCVWPSALRAFQDKTDKADHFQSLLVSKQFLTTAA